MSIDGDEGPTVLEAQKNPNLFERARETYGTALEGARQRLKGGIAGIVEMPKRVGEFYGKADEKYRNTIGRAREGVIDGISGILDHVPSKLLATGVLALGEFVGIGIYALPDAYTAISGLNDLVKSSKIEDSKTKVWAAGRGWLKIIGAAAPAVPSFWVVPALEKVIPIPQIDKVKGKK